MFVERNDKIVLAPIGATHMPLLRSGNTRAVAATNILLLSEQTPTAPDLLFLET